MSIDTSPEGQGFPGREKPQNGPQGARTPARRYRATLKAATGPSGALSGPPPLKPTERVLLDTLTAGLTADQIATRMGLTVPSVRYRLRVLRHRLGVLSTAQLVHRAHELGLLGGAQPVKVRRTAESGLVPEWAPKADRLTPKLRASAADARLIAARLEATYQGGAR